MEELEQQLTNLSINDLEQQLTNSFINDKNNKINELEEQLTNLYVLSIIEEYPNNKILFNLCKSFEKEEITLTAKFLEKYIPIFNCNAVGDILEDIFYPIIKDKLDDFEKGPKQASPDYYAINKTFEFEQKVFMKNPGFDIGNFTSYLNMLCEDGGVYKKLFKTKYLVFEYTIINEKIKIIKFHYLNVYNLVGYSGKTPITMQIKKNIWYNIRPESVKKWYCSTKTPQLFIDKIIECINNCNHIEDKINKISTITKQFENLKLKYTF